MPRVRLNPNGKGEDAMTKFALLAACLIAVVAPAAHAADKAGAPPPNLLQTLDDSLSPMELWKGFYIEGGLGMTASELELTDFGDSLTLGESGVSGHFGIGYDQMIAPQILLGALARIEFSDIEFEALGQDLGDSSIAYMIGARLGLVPREDALLYGLLGYKWTEFDLAQGLGSLDTGGIVLGGGLEVMMTDHVGIGLEYTTTLLDSETVQGTELEPTDHTARLRMLYKW
jgi:opacity protein-like surface antigen